MRVTEMKFLINLINSVNILKVFIVMEELFVKTEEVH